VKNKRWIIIIVIVVIIASVGGAAWWWFKSDNDNVDDATAPNHSTEKLYSNLTGLEIIDISANSAPLYCIQIPNGSTDGARPQVGLNHAGVVFEAIAETGITRFAAVFSGDVDTGIIGPIRSLRPYYLSWDTPFDCTIVHDGGSHEALAEVNNGNYRNLDEDFNYMWKENYINNQYRYWNNVFTSPKLLNEFNHSKNYTTSSPKTFLRLKPAEVAEILASRSPCNAESEESCINEFESATNIHTAFTNQGDYMVNYTYNPSNNSYQRSYVTTGDHFVYDCPTGNIDSCSLVPLTPNVVVIMRVQESTMADGYHEQIQTIGNGQAHIFQNGEHIAATWEKSSQSSQIKFRDAAGNEISFAPGQLWISAIPQFGTVSWE